MTEMNTAKAVESLTRTGFSEEQARAVVDVVSGVVDETAATRQDFAELKAALHSEIAGLTRRFEALEGRFGALEGCFGTLERRFGALEGQVGTLDVTIDAKVARLEASIANAKTQMVLYTGGIVAGVAAISKLFG